MADLSVHVLLDQSDGLICRKLGGVDHDTRLVPGRILAIQDSLPTWECEAVDVGYPLLNAAAMLDGIRTHDFDLDQRRSCAPSRGSLNLGKQGSIQLMLRCAFLLQSARTNFMCSLMPVRTGGRS